MFTIPSSQFRLLAAAALAAVLVSSCGPETATPLPPASDRALRIVSSLPYRGPGAAQGDLIRHGVDMAIDEKRSLVSAWKIEHISLDGGNEETGDWSADAELANARAAARDSSVVAYIGPYASGAAMLSIPVLNHANLLQALPVATWPGLTQAGWASGEPGRYYPTGEMTVVRLMPPDSAQAQLAARKVHELRATTALVVTDGSDYSNGMASTFGAEAEQLGVQVIGPIDVNASAQEWSQSLDKADAVFLAPSNLEVADTAARHIALRVPKVGVFATDVLLSDRLSDQERTLMEGWYLFFNGDLTPGESSRFAEFARKFQARYGVQPSQYAVNAYDITVALLEATARVGVDRQKIAKEVMTGTYEEGIGRPLRFRENGDVQGGALTLYRLDSGAFVQQEELRAP